MKFSEYYLKEAFGSVTKIRGYYDGSVQETGGTSIAGNVAPAVVWLDTKGVFKDAETILDYGAGKYVRNADYLRNKDYKVYAYDPFNGKPEVDPYELGSVSKELPDKEMFDVGMSVFVINVVKKSVQDYILDDVKKWAKNTYHISRNKDIFDMVKKNLLLPTNTKDSLIIKNFFINEFSTDEEKEMLEQKILPDDIIEEFCYFGVQTSRGFQRIPFDTDVEEQGFSLIKNTGGWKIYKST